MADEQAEARGIHMGHIREIEDVPRRGFCFLFWFVIENVAERDLLHGTIHVACIEYPSDLVDNGARRLAVDPFDSEARALPQLSARDRHRLRLYRARCGLRK